jgi:excisionase family DNA binding protein
MVTKIYIKQGMLTITEAARRLGVTVTTLRNWEAKGHIKVAKDENGRRMFPEDRLEEMHEHCRRKSFENYRKAAKKRGSVWPVRRQRYGESGSPDGKMFGKKVVEDDGSERTD